MTIEQAKQVLQDNGYFVDNLWHVDDVPNGTDDERMEILEIVLTSPYIMERINIAIIDESRNIGL
jgi:hypothetical protein